LEIKMKEAACFLDQRNLTQTYDIYSF